MKWIPEGAVTGHRSKRPNVSGPQSECAGLEAYSAIESTSLCLPTLNSRSCDAGCEATATDRFTADDAEAVTSPPPDRTAIQASNMVSHLCIESKDNEKIRTVKLFRHRIGAPEDERPNPTNKKSQSDPTGPFRTRNEVKYYITTN